MFRRIFCAVVLLDVSWGMVTPCPCVLSVLRSWCSGPAGWRGRGRGGTGRAAPAALAAAPAPPCAAAQISAGLEATAVHDINMEIRRQPLWLYFKTVQWEQGTAIALPQVGYNKSPVVTSMPSM